MGSVTVNFDTLGVVWTTVRSVEIGNIGEVFVMATVGSVPVKYVLKYILENVEIGVSEHLRSLAKLQSPVSTYPITIDNESWSSLS